MDISGYASLATALGDASSTDGLTLTSLAKASKSTLEVSDDGSGDTDPGDTVNLSEEARALSSAESEATTTGTAIAGSFSIDGGALSMTGAGSTAGATEESSDTSDTADTSYEKLLKQIQELQQQIRETQNDPSLTEEQKQAKVQQLQSQLMELETQLVKAQAASVGTTEGYHGGTRCAYAQSLT